MSKLFIQVNESNVPQGHPVFENNLKQCFPKHDFDSGPPSGWLEFERTPEPKLGVYEKFDDTKGSENCDAFEGHNGLTYELVDGKIKDTWHILPMTDEEKTKKQEQAKVDYGGPESWKFNEITCEWEAPIPYPSDGKDYSWNDSTSSWELIPYTVVSNTGP
tara:strand:+ start:88 stop:570 length:483 start_codon:yes stop_codon:yes gene_type:complete